MLTVALGLHVAHLDEAVGIGLLVAPPVHEDVRADDLDGLSVHEADVVAALDRLVALDWEPAPSWVSDTGCLVVDWEAVGSMVGGRLVYPLQTSGESDVMLGDLDLDAAGGVLLDRVGADRTGAGTLHPMCWWLPSLAQG